LGVVAFIAAAYAKATPVASIPAQGRYALPALVPMAALAAFACLGLGRRRAPAVAGALLGAMVALSLGGWVQALSSWYT
jgi:lipopolysaccharide export LptBFGC system permease protein LptF